MEESRCSEYLCIIHWRNFVDYRILRQSLEELVLIDAREAVEINLGRFKVKNKSSYKMNI